MDSVGRIPVPASPPGRQPTLGPGPKEQTADPDAPLRKAAQDLEASFLSLMLKSAGLGEVPDFAGGGEGEEQFASFLRDEQAKKMVAAGGIGLAEHLFEALKQGKDNA